MAAATSPGSPTRPAGLAAATAWKKPARDLAVHLIAAGQAAGSPGSPYGTDGTDGRGGAGGLA